MICPWQICIEDIYTYIYWLSSRWFASLLPPFPSEWQPVPNSSYFVSSNKEGRHIGPKDSEYVDVNMMTYIGTSTFALCLWKSGKFLQNTHIRL